LPVGQPNDIIIIAGKGHETYQEIKGIEMTFDDMKIVKETLENFINSKNMLYYLFEYLDN
jgi:UDP-N-acetylmuramoyl-L-alanyl-D-glutamate--2,6-diaminopimelate ligase